MVKTCSLAAGPEVDLAGGGGPDRLGPGVCWTRTSLDGMYHTAVLPMEDVGRAEEVRLMESEW